MGNKKIFLYDSRRSSGRGGTRTGGRKWITPSYPAGENPTTAGGSGPLCVGDVRLDPITSDDGNAVSTGTNGSLIHCKLTEVNTPLATPSVDGVPRRTPTDVHRLVASNTRRMREVYSTCASVQKAQRKEESLEHAAQGGFWSLGARRRQTKMEEAADHLCEVVMSIDERGSTVSHYCDSTVTDGFRHPTESRLLPKDAFKISCSEGV